MIKHLVCGSYKIIEKDLSDKIMREVTNIIKNSSLDDSIKLKVTLNNEIMAHIYGLPKIHKDGIPLRPILNTIGSPTYLLAKVLDKQLLPFAGNTSSYIKKIFFFC